MNINDTPRSSYPEKKIKNDEKKHPTNYRLALLVWLVCSTKQEY